jgi:polar amino acid transport system permease protein
MGHYFTQVIPGVVDTAVITCGAYLIGAVLGALVAWMRRAHRRPVRVVARWVVELIRAVPVLVWLFIVFYGLPQYGISLSPVVAATLTLGVIASAYLSEIYRGGLAAIDRGQWDASAALGLSRRDTALRVIVPQTLRVSGPAMAGYGIWLLKDSALASTIGVVELTYRASAEAQTTGKGLTVFIMVGVIYLLLGLPMAVASRSVDRRMRTRYSMS